MALPLTNARKWQGSAKDKTVEDERIANELHALEPPLIELLIAVGEKAPALT